MRTALILATWLAIGTGLLGGCGVAPRLDAPGGDQSSAPAAAHEDAKIEQLEPYDAGRIPVLFVHGIGGSPRDFDAMLRALDRKQFQAWVLHYPTSTRLQAAARDMGRQLAALHRQHEYARLIIVAHSMGGLVARRYLIDTGQAGERGPACALVTFSSPWGGNEWAGIGARMVPEPPGPWIDLAPDSAFLQSLRDVLPKVRHYVFFGYRRAPSLLTSQSSDGAITLASQMPEWVQQQAERSWGYDADHTGILSHAPALDRLNALLALQSGC